MNIHDVEWNECPNNPLEDIFERQCELMAQYCIIEKENGLRYVTDYPVNVHDRFGQATLKDFAWRTTEELAEAIEAYELGDFDHFQEELADALHFLVEFCIYAGVDPKMILRGATLQERMDELTKHENYRGVSGQAFQVVIGLGLACNCLKNKPWKQSHVKTDLIKFQGLTTASFNAFLVLAKRAMMDAEKLYNFYFRKNKVNQFRQRSNY